MASRSTRNQSRNLQRTPSTSPTPPVQSSPRTARKSMRGRTNTRSSANVSTPPASIPSTSQSSPLLRSKARKSLPSKKPRMTRKSSVSSDSSSRNTQIPTSTVPNVQDSSDSEDAVVTSSKRKIQRKRIQVHDSDNEASDTEYAPSPEEAGKRRRSVSSPNAKKPSSVPSSSVYNVNRGASTLRLNTSLDLNSSESSSSQGSFMKLVNQCVFYILVADRKKHAIKKTDILKHVFKKSKEKYSDVFNKVSEVLKKTFGFEILDITDKKNNYILINILESDYGVKDFAEYSPEELQKKGLIFLLLTIIFMNENVIAEDKLWKAVEPLELFPNSQIPHPIFGNVKKYVTIDLVKEMYLDYICVNKDPIQHEFRWGERAVQEFNKEDCLEFACKMLDKKPEDWKLQYIDAKERPSTLDAEN